MFGLAIVFGQAECGECGCQLRQGDRAHAEKQEDASVFWLCQGCYPPVMESRYTISLEANLTVNPVN
jgi:hypothetical protein